MHSPDSSTGSTPLAPARGKPLLDRRGNVYQPAIGPRLKILLALIFASVAVLGATGAYLSAIRALEWFRAPQTYTNQFSIWMFFIHVAVGFLIALPFLFFGFTHYFTARHRKNRPAVRLGITLFITGIVVVVTGLALNQLPVLPRLPTETVLRTLIFWLHVISPLAAVALYVLHRRAGPDIKWSWGIGWGAAVGIFVVFMLVMHSQDPRRWYATGPREGQRYFFPSQVRTVGGNFIPAKALMMDAYCLKCHQDIYNDHYHSAHKFSSFNNPAYLFSVLKTREMGMDRENHVRASRWCAGCHDIVPFLSGQFDNPDYDVFKDPTAHAGITCTVCHAITNIDSPMGNAAYTIEEPLHYPFAYSDNEVLQWINNQLVKAKPDFHKRTMLKPFHKTAEFCSTCHKVSLPGALNHYKEFLRGQNHYDTYLLSGVSGVGARSFYYPPVAKTNCAECHMPLKESADFGARDFDKSGKRKVHSHLFPAANTGLPWLLSHELKPRADPEMLKRAAQVHADFLRGTDPRGSDKKVRIDLFGIKVGRTPDEDGTIKSELIAPLRPKLPVLKPGRTYLVEVVIRTVNLGHPFPQGTADSNEIWVDFTARSGARVIGRSGALKSQKAGMGEVDRGAHFVNIFMLDRNGNRINRRNPEDILVPLYDHQIPPGAGQVVHYKLTVPSDVKDTVELKVRLRYRKFDREYMSLVYGKESKVPRQHDADGNNSLPRLPIVDMCEDQVTLPVEGMADAADVLKKLRKQQSPIKPSWQRWNDYGIGCFLEGTPGGNKVEGQKQEGELDQAEKAFTRLAHGKEFAQDPLARGNGLINLGRVYNDMGQLRKAVAVLKEVNALNRAHPEKPPVPWWTVAWVTGQINVRNQHWDEAIVQFEKILDPSNQPRKRKFDFTRDYVVITSLAKALYERSQDRSLEPAPRTRFLERSIAAYERVLAIDPENLDAHIGLMRCYNNFPGKALPIPARQAPTAAEKELLKLAQAAFGNLDFVSWEEIKPALAQKQLVVLKSLARARRSLKAQREAARQFEKALDQFGERSVDLDSPRLSTLLDLAERCAPVSIYLAVDVKDQDGGKVGKVVRCKETEALQAAAKRLLYKLHQQAYRLLRSRGQVLADNKATSRRRLEAAARLDHEVLLLARSRSVPEFTRVPLLLAVINPARKTFGSKPDAEVRSAATVVLAHAHSVMHAIYKPDDNAREIIELFRTRPENRAATHASHPVVIYPLGSRR